MSDQTPPSDLPAALAIKIDEICDQYELDLISGKSPDLEDYLRRVEANERDSLAAELLPLAAEYKSKHNEQQVIADEPGRLSQEVFAQTASTFVSASAAPPISDSVPPTANTIAVLTVVTGPHQGKKFPLARDGRFLVGRASTADLQISSGDTYSSRLHFQIDTTETSCRLTNLSRTNGTLVNGQRVETADLSEGDVILVGETAIRVRIQRG